MAGPRREYRPKPRDEITRNMSAIRSQGNKTEVALRRALHRRGLRFRIYRRDLPGRPDIVFSGARVAVFIDGDYWHARLYVEGGEAALAAKLAVLSADRQRYWREKFMRRVARDREVTTALKADGWCVLRYWESAVKADPEPVASDIARRVRRRTRRSV